VRATSFGAAGGGERVWLMMEAELKVLPIVSIEAIAFDLVT